MEQPIAIQCFLAAARLGSFTEAAAELYMTRQAVSKQVLRLERDLGTELFLRTSRRAEITPAGKLFAAYYIEQAERFEAVCRQVEQLSGGDSSIRIGYLYGIEIDAALYDVTKAYRKHHPLPPIHWERGNPLDLLQDVENGALDIAITFTDDQTRRTPGLRVSPIGMVPMVVAVSAENPLVGAAVSAKDFEKETFYAWKKRQSDTASERENIIRHGMELGLQLEHVELLDSRETVKTVMEMGSGAALCTALDNICSSPRIRVYPLEQTNELGCAYRMDAAPVIRDLAEALSGMRLNRSLSTKQLTIRQDPCL